MMDRIRVEVRLTLQENLSIFADEAIVRATRQPTAWVESTPMRQRTQMVAESEA
jgi:hypothetical protein